MLNEVRDGVNEMRDMNFDIRDGRLRGDFASDSGKSIGEAGSSITKDIENTIKNSKNLE
jgi:hypothetical protein